MKVSIVIPTYNRLGQLKSVLRGLENQTYPREQFEVLVVSDGSADGTDEYLKSATPPFKLRTFFQRNQGAATARNLGTAEAMGEIVLFIDDDVFPLPMLIEEHIRFHRLYGDHAVVIGPMLAPPDFKMSPWVRWETEKLAEQYREMSSGKWPPTARQFYTGNTSLSREHFLKTGGFDPSFRRAEDVELAFRLDDRGLKFYFNPHAAGYHYAERSFVGWLAIPYAYGHNDVIFSQQKGRSWLLPILMKEYHQRHFLTQTIIQVSLSRSVVNEVVLNLLKQVALLGEKLHLNRISSIACSGMFNLRYYQGVADQLGDRKAFLKG